MIRLIPELHYKLPQLSIPANFSTEASPEVYEIENNMGPLLKYCFSI